MDWTDYQYSGDGKMSESDLNVALQKRDEEMQQFQQFQRGPTQIAESIKPPTELGKEFYREGFWAVPDLPHTHHLPYPQEGQNWQGKDQVLAVMKQVQNQLRREMVRYKQDETCCLCGQEKLGNGEYVDRNNKVIWREGYEHYIDKHNVVPTKFFFNYIQMAGQAIGKKTASIHVPPPAQPSTIQPSQQAPQPTRQQQGQLTPLERLQQGTYYPPQPVQGPPQPGRGYPQQPVQGQPQPVRGPPQQPQMVPRQMPTQNPYPHPSQQPGQLYIPPYLQPRP